VPDDEAALLRRSVVADRYGARRLLECDDPPVVCCKRAHRLLWIAALLPGNPLLRTESRLGNLSARWTRGVASEDDLLHGKAVSASKKRADIPQRTDIPGNEDDPTTHGSRVQKTLTEVYGRSSNMS